MTNVEPVRPVRLRHIRPGLPTDSGALLVADFLFAPDPIALNGRQGWQSGTIERRLLEESSGELTLPNDSGQDGRRHLDRFGVITSRNYRPGDEWIEVWEGDIGAGDLLATLTPTAASRSRTAITVKTLDALSVLRHTREGSAGFWRHAARDVITFYSRLKQYPLADSFTTGEDWLFNSAEQISFDGWRYTRAAKLATEDYVDLVAQPSFTSAEMWRSIPDTDRHGAARVEVVLDLPAMTANDVVNVGLLNSNDTGAFVVSITSAAVSCRTGNLALQAVPLATPAGRHRIAVEVRERWVWFYVDGRLVSTLPRNGDWRSTQDVVIDRVKVLVGAGNDGARRVRVHSVKYHRLIPFLLPSSADRGPETLAGAPPVEGLASEWFSDTDRPLARTLEPVAEPAGKRVDPEINFPGANPPLWRHPNVTSNGAWSARFTGAVYLADPANTTLRVHVDGRCRLWLGATRWGEQLIDVWDTPDTGSTLWSAPVGPRDGPGWYPIRIEYQSDGGGAGLHVYTSVGGGPNRALGADNGAPLTPLGCVSDTIRRLSHFEVLSDVARDFAVQYRVDPRSLESGEFPGVLRLGHRLGRKSSLVITDDDASAVEVETRAEGAVDALTADAAGLADPESAAQLAAELLDFAAVQPGTHLAAHEEHEQLSDVATEAALLQRLSSMLTLRANVWEQVSARPGTRRPLTDQLPLTGELAELAWEPGDAARLELDSVALVDAEPRQAMGVKRAIVPDGVGLPVLTWRQRPRGIREDLRALQRQALDPQRNYQGQLSIIPGSFAASWFADTASRVSWNRDAASLVSAALVVQWIGAGASWNVLINGAPTGKTATTRGRIDVTPWVARVAGSRIYAQLTGGTGGYEMSLELTVRI